MCDAEDAGGREGRRPGADGREGEGEGTSGLAEAELFQFLREIGYLHAAAARHSRVELQHVDACPRSGMMGGDGGREASARGSEGMRGRVDDDAGCDARGPATNDVYRNIPTRVQVEGLELEIGACLDSLHGLVSVAQQLDRAFANGGGRHQPAARGGSSGSSQSQSGSSGGGRAGTRHVHCEGAEGRGQKPTGGGSVGRSRPLNHPACPDPPAAANSYQPDGLRGPALGRVASAGRGRRGAGGLGDAEDDWESVVVGECEDDMLQAGITRLFRRGGGGGNGSRAGLSVRAAYFSRRVLAARRRGVRQRGAAATVAVLEIKGVRVRCRVFGGCDWPESAQHAAALLATQEIDDDIVAVRRHPASPRACACACRVCLSWPAFGLPVFLYLCLCVCLHACMHAHTHARTHARTHAPPTPPLPQKLTHNRTGDSDRNGCARKTRAAVGHGWWLVSCSAFARGWWMVR